MTAPRRTIVRRKPGQDRRYVLLTLSCAHVVQVTLDSLYRDTEPGVPCPECRRVGTR
jgi:hypothetical protein